MNELGTSDSAPRTEADWIALEWEIGRLFSGAPVREEDLFAGRPGEILRMLETVLEPGKHVVLYGERGVGKTSIANVFWKRYNERLQTVIAARVQADPSDTFSSIWLKALDEFRTVSIQIGRSELVPISTAYEQVSPDNIRQELQKCRANAIPIIIIDEFDKLADTNAKELSANVLKSLYDYTVNVTIILVGVAENIGELVKDHQSLRRTLSPIKLNRMNVLDMNEVIDKRVCQTPITFSGGARTMTIKLSLGLPYYVQILGKFACQNAVRRHSLDVSEDDVRCAMDKLIAESGESFFEEYRVATQSNQADNLFREVLLSCALAETDESGFFTPSKALGPFSHIIGDPRKHAHIQRHLSEFITNRRGDILIRRGLPRQYRYRFSDPLMQPYIIIKGIRENMLDENIIWNPQYQYPRLPIVS